MTKFLVIFGSGGHGKVVADSASMMREWEKIIFFDDILGAGSSFTDIFDLSITDFDIVIAIGNNTIREKKMQILTQKGFNMPIIKHPTAIVANESKIGKGTVLMAGAIINPGVKLGRGCIINTGAIVDHDCNLDDFVHISPGTQLAGSVMIGDRTWVGIGASVCENRTIGKDVIVAGGAVVISDIDDNRTIKGVPAK